MWKKLLIAVVSLVAAFSIAYKYNDNEIKAVGYITGSPGDEAANSLKTGDIVHLGGSTMIGNDNHVVLGQTGGYVYFLRVDGANSNKLATYTDAKSYVNSYGLGAVGSKHFKQNGNNVGLISKAELQSIPGLVSGNTINSSIPSLSGNWWLNDANTSTNRASFVNGSNLNADGGIKKTTRITCAVGSNGETGVMPIVSENETPVLKTKRVDEAKITVLLNHPTYSAAVFTESTCNNDNIQGRNTIPKDSFSGRVFTYGIDASGVESYRGNGAGLPVSVLANTTWRPRVVWDSSTDTFVLQNDYYGHKLFQKGVCYKGITETGNPKISGAAGPFTKVNGSYTIDGDPIPGGTDNVYVTNIRATFDTSSVKYTTVNCDTLTNNAGTAQIRPYIKVKVSDILMRNHTKRTYQASSTLSTDNVPVSDNEGSYLTISTTSMGQVSLRSGESGVSGSTFTTKKPKGSNVVSLPLTFYGQVEGSRYISAEATDKDGNTVYGVLSAVGNATSGNVDIDFSNLLSTGSNSFQVTLYIEDAGSRSIAYRSEGTTITVNFEQEDLSIAFDDPNQTKKSIGEAATSWNETATPSVTEGTKVTYRISGGTAGILSIDPDTGAITQLNNTCGKVKIEATVDDDPSTGFDNYNPATTTKEIVIYRELAFRVDPGPNSLSGTDPSFEANADNVKNGGLIGTIVGEAGTPDNLDGASTTTTYLYELKTEGDSAHFSVDPNSGEIRTTAPMLNVGTYQITVMVSDKWSTKEKVVTINVGLAAAEDLRFYKNSTSTEMITEKRVSLTDSNVSVFAKVKDGDSTVDKADRYDLDPTSSTDIVEVSANGSIILKKTGTVTIIAEKAGAPGQAKATAQLTLIVEAGEQNFIYTDKDGNELAKNGNEYEDYEHVYVKDGTFQLYTAGYPSSATVTYALDPNSETDVILVDSDGMVHILNASEASDLGNVIVLATSHDENGGYADKTIALPITITQAEQTISFKGKTYVENGSGSVVPRVETMDVSSNAGGVIIQDSDYQISIGSGVDTSIAWMQTGDKKTVYYNHSGEGMNIALHVEKAGTRNYKKAEADGILRILGPGESLFALNTPSKVTYGDQFTIGPSDVNDGATYTYTLSNNSYIESSGTNGNESSYKAIKASGNDTVTITVKREKAGEESLEQDVTIKVYPKDIEITIDDKEKEQGSENPEFTYQDFTSQLISWNGKRDVILTEDIQLTTTATKTSEAGKYPITLNIAYLNTTYPNYQFKSNEGSLTIIGKQVPSKPVNPSEEGICVVGPDGTAGSGDEVCGKPGSDGKQPTKENDGSVKVPEGGSVEFPNGTILPTPDGALIKPDGTVILPDGTEYDAQGNKKNPQQCKLEGIEINIDSDGDGIPDVNIDLDKDCKADLNIDVDGDKVPDINIDTDLDGKPDYNIDSDGDGKADVNIGPVNKPWNPSVCKTVGDITYCSDPYKKPYLNVDSDGDGRPDLNIDLDGDKEADINIDIDGDGIPDLDIDSDGDGKPDINIDSDGDGKADRNLLKLTEWKPEKNVDGQIKYDTMSGLKVQSNTDNDKNIGSYHNVNTGDSMKLPLWWILVLINGCIMFYFFILVKREKEEEEEENNSQR